MRHAGTTDGFGLHKLVRAFLLVGLMTVAISLVEPASHAQVVAASGGASIFPFDDTRFEGADFHDPSIVEFKGDCLLFCTSRNEFCPVWSSHDLMHWRTEGPILPDQPEWLKEAIPHRSIWAPAPLIVGDKLRVYYCASERFGVNTSYIGMAENDHFDPAHPTAGWVDKGKIIESHADKDKFNAIDPDALVGPDGRHWMVYGSYWDGIFLVELDPATGLLKDPAKPPLHVASNTGERGNPLEDPCLRYHDGYYYLYVTYGLAAQGVRSTYRMMVGRSKDPEGPYLGFDGKPMTEGGHAEILKSSPPMFAPGGGNVFQDAKGNWFLAYHYYDGTRHWVRDLWGKPTLQMRPIVWGPDGWPLPDLPQGVELEGRPRDSVAGKWLHQADFSDVAELDLEPGGVARLPGQTGRWELSGDRLQLHWPKADAPGEAWVDTLTLDETRQYYVGRNQSGAIIRGIRVDAKARKL